MKLKRITLALLCTSLLGGTVVAATMPQIASPTVSTKSENIIFKIKNDSIDKISRLKIHSADGREIYQGKFMCNMDQLCQVNIGKKTINGLLTFKFYNSGNKLISAYTTVNQYDTSSIITANDTMLGIYVYEQLKNTSKLEPAALNNKLTKFFSNYQSPDNMPDEFEELGLYYIAKTKSGAMNDNQFYKNLTLSLSKGTALPGKVIKPTARPAAFASMQQVSAANGNGICSNTSKSAFSYLGSIIGFIPIIGNVANNLFDIGGQILSDACPEDTSINDRFAKIDERLNEIEAKLNVQGYNIANLYQQINQTAIETIKSTLDKEYGELTTNITSYTGIVGNNNKSLADYVSQNGGFRNVYASNQPIRDLYSSIGMQVQNFNGLISNNDINRLGTALNNWCGKPNDITGDVIARRIQCNVIIADVVTRINLSAIRAKKMLNDEINVVVTEQKLGNIDNTWLEQNVGKQFNGSSQNVNWDQASAFVNKLIDDKVTEATNVLLGANGSKMFRPLGGDNNMDQLFKNMIAIDCKVKPGQNELPAVLEWHTNTTNAKPYIVSNCKNDNVDIQSKYYYTNPDKKIDPDVRNVLGVLVPSSFFKKNNGFAATSWNYVDQCGSEFWGSNYRTYCGYRVRLSKSAKVNNTISSLDSSSKIIQPQADLEYALPHYPGNYQWVYKNIGSSGNETRYETFQSTWDKDNFIYERMTLILSNPTSGDSMYHVFAVNTDLWLREKYAANRTFTRFDQKCMTYDCSVDGQSLSFEEGPTISFVAPAKKGGDYTLSVVK